MAYTPGLWLYILASVIIFALIITSLRYRRTPTGQAFLLVMVCALIWVVEFTLETAVIGLDRKLFLSNLGFLGVTFLPAAWINLVMAYTGRTRSKWVWALILLVPVLTNLVIWTNPLHHWFFGQPRLDLTSAPFAVVVPDYQVWFYAVHAPSGYLFLSGAVVAMGISIARTRGIYRIQAQLLLAALLLPAITDVLYVLGFSPLRHYNTTPAVFSLSGLLLAWTLFRFRFLDLLPLALDTVMDNLSDGIIVLDHKQRVVEANATAQAILQIPRLKNGCSLQGSGSEILERIAIALVENETQIDFELAGSEAAPDPKTYDLRILPVRARSGLQVGWVTTMRDITERVRLFKELQTLAMQDGLTGIFNRRYFLELGKREIIRLQRFPSASLGVLLVDLDRFKIVNDTYGHPAGDQVLMAFAQAIGSRLRMIDIFGRLGGEEFAILLSDVDVTTMLEVAERLRAAVEAMRVNAAGQEIGVTASFGAVCSLEVARADLNIDHLIHLADQAMYQAKDQGRNQVVLWRG